MPTSHHHHHHAEKRRSVLHHTKCIKQRQAAERLARDEAMTWLNRRHASATTIARYWRRVFRFHTLRRTLRTTWAIVSPQHLSRTSVPTLQAEWAEHRAILSRLLLRLRVRFFRLSASSSSAGQQPPNSQQHQAKTKKKSRGLTPTTPTTTTITTPTTGDDDDNNKRGHQKKEAEEEEEDRNLPRLLPFDPQHLMDCLALHKAPTATLASWDVRRCLPLPLSPVAARRLREMAREVVWCLFRALRRPMRESNSNNKAHRLLLPAAWYQYSQHLLEEEEEIRAAARLLRLTAVAAPEEEEDDDDAAHHHHHPQKQQQAAMVVMMGPPPPPKPEDDTAAEETALEKTKEKAEEENEGRAATLTATPPPSSSVLLLLQPHPQSTATTTSGHVVLEFWRRHVRPFTLTRLVLDLLQCEIALTTPPLQLRHCLLVHRRQPTLGHSHSLSEVNLAIARSPLSARLYRLTQRLAFLHHRRMPTREAQLRTVDLLLHAIITECLCKKGKKPSPTTTTNTTTTGDNDDDDEKQTKKGEGEEEEEATVATRKRGRRNDDEPKRPNRLDDDGAIRTLQRTMDDTASRALDIFVSLLLTVEEDDMMRRMTRRCFTRPALFSSSEPYRHHHHLSSQAQSEIALANTRMARAAHKAQVARLSHYTMGLALYDEAAARLRSHNIARRMRLHLNTLRQTLLAHLLLPPPPGSPDAIRIINLTTWIEKEGGPPFLWKLHADVFVLRRKRAAAILVRFWRRARTHTLKRLLEQLWRPASSSAPHYLSTYDPHFKCYNGNEDRPLHTAAAEQMSIGQLLSLPLLHPPPPALRSVVRRCCRGLPGFVLTDNKDELTLTRYLFFMLVAYTRPALIPSSMIPDDLFYRSLPLVDLFFVPDRHHRDVSLLMLVRRTLTPFLLDCFPRVRGLWPKLEQFLFRCMDEGGEEEEEGYETDEVKEQADEDEEEPVRMEAKDEGRKKETADARKQEEAEKEERGEHRRQKGANEEEEDGAEEGKGCAPHFGDAMDRLEEEFDRTLCTMQRLLLTLLPSSALARNTTTTAKGQDKAAEEEDKGRMQRMMMKKEEGKEGADNNNTDEDEDEDEEEAMRKEEREALKAFIKTQVHRIHRKITTLCYKTYDNMDGGVYSDTGHLAVNVSTQAILGGKELTLCRKSQHTMMLLPPPDHGDRGGGRTADDAHFFTSLILSNLPACSFKTTELHLRPRDATAHHTSVDLGAFRPEFRTDGVALILRLEFYSQSVALIQTRYAPFLVFTRGDDHRDLAITVANNSVWAVSLNTTDYCPHDDDEDDDNYHCTDGGGKGGGGGRATPHHPPLGIAIVELKICAACGAPANGKCSFCWRRRRLTIRYCSPQCMARDRPRHEQQACCSVWKGRSVIRCAKAHA